MRRRQGRRVHPDRVEERQVSSKHNQSLNRRQSYASHRHRPHHRRTWSRGRRWRLTSHRRSTGQCACCTDDSPPHPAQSRPCYRQHPQTPAESRHCCQCHPDQATQSPAKTIHIRAGAAAHDSHKMARACKERTGVCPRHTNKHSSTTATHHDVTNGRLCLLHLAQRLN
jgi:hypothetical protein